jgi:hypothetical protein
MSHHDSQFCFSQRLNQRKSTFATADFFNTIRSIADSEPVSANSNSVSSIQIWILKKRDRRLSAKIREFQTRKGARYGQETQRPPVNVRRCRRYFRETETALGDGTGWLGYQDSNLEMANPKMPFDSSARFPLILERFGTGDFSPPGCAKLRIHLPGALAALGARMRTGLGRKFWKIGSSAGNNPAAYVAVAGNKR